MLGTLQWGIRQLSETENQLTSVERLLEYAKLEPEPSLGPGLSGQKKFKWILFPIQSIEVES